MITNVFLAHDGPSWREWWELFTEGRLVLLLVYSVTIGVGASSMALLIGVPIGFLLSRTNIPGRRFLQIAVLTPLIIPPYIVALSWTHLLGAQSPLNRFISEVLSLQGPPLSVYGYTGVVFVLGLAYFPFIVLLAQSGLASIDRRLEDASLINGGWPKAIRNVTIPLLKPFIIVGGVFVFVLSISNYGVPSLLRANVYPMEIFIRFSAYYQEQQALALALPLLAITLSLIVIMKRSLGRRSFTVLTSSVRPSQRIDLRKWKYPCLIGVAGILVFSSIAPVFSLIGQSATWSALAVAFKTAHGQIFQSMFYAGAAATIATALGFALGYYIERNRGPISDTGDLLSMLPFATPPVILGIGLILMWNRPWLEAVYSSDVIVVLGYVAISIPFSVRIISAGVKQLDLALEEVAMLHSDNWWLRMRRVVIPLCRPSLAVAWSICFLLCMYELGMTLLVIPPGKATVSVRIYTLLHYGASQLVSALALILIIAGMIPVVLLLWITQRGRSWSFNA